MVLSRVLPWVYLPVEDAKRVVGRLMFSSGAGCVGECDSSSSIAASVTKVRTTGIPELAFKWAHMCRHDGAHRIDVVDRHAYCVVKPNRLGAAWLRSSRALPRTARQQQLPLARMVRTLQNPASVNAVATRHLEADAADVDTAQKRAANLAIPDCTRPPENDAMAT